ncbi:MAG: GSCFA domain-containing protein [Pseudomonadota bacterium]
MTDATFPYYSVPREARWRDVMAGRAAREIDPHFGSTLRILPEHKIASAGSCFAQRIAEALQAAGYNYQNEEPGTPFMTPAERTAQGYGLYSARYGNIYTALQLLQLLRRAYGRFTPAEPLWRLPSGGWVDPFRAAVQPDGFASESECTWDREAHLAAVRRVFEQTDLFIFTLGLTETWCSRADGAAFPACPGSSLGGKYDPELHEFHNFSVGEVVAHMDAFIEEFRAVNPKAQILLTVSPVPLLATYEPRHVLQATVYSKSVLRVAAEELVKKHAHVHYFGSYEIVNSTGDSAAYFLDDKRGVADAAVAHVIECFHRQFTDYDAAAVPTGAVATPQAAAARKPVCDEDLVMAALADQAQSGRTPE